MIGNAEFSQSYKYKELFWLNKKQFERDLCEGKKKML